MYDPETDACQPAPESPLGYLYAEVPHLVGQERIVGEVVIGWRADGRIWGRKAWPWEIRKHEIEELRKAEEREREIESRVVALRGYLR